jgi:uncharacterized membrane protein
MMIVYYSRKNILDIYHFKVNDERGTCQYRWAEEVEVVLPIVVVLLVVVASKMVACGGQRGRQKLTCFACCC